MILHKTIICSYKDFSQIKDRFPKKTISPAIECPEGEFFFAKKYPNGVFMVKISDWSIWLPDEFPFFRKTKHKLKSYGLHSSS